MPGFISNIKAKLPSMSLKSPLATPLVDPVDPSLGLLAPGPELSVPPPEETTCPAPEDSDAKPDPTLPDPSLHVPGELPIASTSSLALDNSAPALPSPSELAPQPESVDQAPAPVLVLPASDPQPEDQTLLVGPVTGGEPGLSEPVPGLSSSSPEETPAQEAPVDTATEPCESIDQVPPPAESVEASQPIESIQTPGPAEAIEAGAPVDSMEACPALPDAGNSPPVASALAFPPTQAEGGEAKENVAPRGMGRTIRQSIRRLGRSTDKVPSRKSLDPNARKSADVKAMPEGTPRKSVDVRAVPEETENAEAEALAADRKKVPLGDKLKGVFEEVKGRVKKNPEGVAYGKALRSGDVNV